MKSTILFENILFRQIFILELIRNIPNKRVNAIKRNENPTVITILDDSGSTNGVQANKKGIKSKI